MPLRLPCNIVNQHDIQSYRLPVPLPEVVVPSRAIGCVVREVEGTYLQVQVLLCYKTERERSAIIERRSQRMWKNRITTNYA